MSKGSIFLKIGKWVWKPVSKYGAAAAKSIANGFAKIVSKVPAGFKTKASAAMSKVFKPTGAMGKIWRVFNIGYFGSEVADLVKVKRTKRAVIDVAIGDRDKVLENIAEASIIDGCTAEEKDVIVAFTRTYAALPDLLEIATDDQLNEIDKLLKSKPISQLSAEEISTANISDELKAVLISAANSAAAAEQANGSFVIPNVIDYANAQLIAMNCAAMLAIAYDGSSDLPLTPEEGGILIASLDESKASTMFQELLKTAFEDLNLRDQNLIWCNYEITLDFSPCAVGELYELFATN